MIDTTVTGKPLAIATGLRLPIELYGRVVDLSQRRGQKLNRVLVELIELGMSPSQCAGTDLAAKFAASQARIGELEQELDASRKLVNELREGLTGILYAVEQAMAK